MGKIYQAMTRNEMHQARQTVSETASVSVTELNFAGQHLRHNAQVSVDDPDRSGNRMGHTKILELTNHRLLKLISYLDTEILKSIIEYKFLLSICGYPNFISGEAIVFNKFTFFKLNIKTKFKLTLLLDRSGKLLNFNGAGNENKSETFANVDKIDSFRGRSIRKIEENMLARLFGSINSRTSREVFEDVLGVRPQKAISCVGGNIVVVDDKIAYEMAVATHFDYSLLLNDTGGFLGITTDIANGWKQILMDYTADKSYPATINLFKNR